VRTPGHREPPGPEADALAQPVQRHERLGPPLPRCGYVAPGRPVSRRPSRCGGGDVPGDAGGRRDSDGAGRLLSAFDVTPTLVVDLSTHIGGTWLCRN